MTETSDAPDDTSDAGPAVDPATVEHIAELARVRLEVDERELFAEQFAEILDAFAALDEVPEMDREEPLVNVMRPDEVDESLSQSAALANAEETDDGFFVGPKVS